MAEGDGVASASARSIRFLFSVPPLGWTVRSTLGSIRLLQVSDKDVPAVSMTSDHTTIYMSRDCSWRTSTSSRRLLAPVLVKLRIRSYEFQDDRRQCIRKHGSIASDRTGFFSVGEAISAVPPCFAAGNQSTRRAEFCSSHSLSSEPMKASEQQSAHSAAFSSPSPTTGRPTIRLIAPSAAQWHWSV